jgi:hypothetical protein
LPPAELAELYRSAPADFIATRDRLVREHRAAGDTEGARELARRRKPTRAAAALNVLAHDHAADLGAYLALAPALRDAQLAAARDASARDELRTIDRERRDRLGGLLARTGADREEAERALVTALVDPELAAQLRAGTLDRVPEAPTGFGAFAETEPSELAPVIPLAPKQTAAQRKREEQLRNLDDELADARVELAECDREVDAAREALTRAERERTAAERVVTRLVERRKKLDPDE